MTMRHSTIDARRRPRGAAAVELALLTIPLIMMVLAAAEFARGIYHYNVIVKATRDAARLLSGFDPTVAADYPATAARNRVRYGPQGVGGELLVPGITDAMIQICNRVDSTSCPGINFANYDTGAGTINLVRVQVVGYSYQPFFGVAGVLTGGMAYANIGTTMRSTY